MTRGFYTGMAAALVFFALSVLWLLSSAQSYHHVSDLVQFESLKVSERTADALPFFSSAVADAESDAAYGAYGCVPTGDFISESNSRILNYTLTSAGVLSDSSVNVSVAVADIAPLALLPVPNGFDQAYRVNSSLNVTIRGGPLKAFRLLNVSDVVLVNSSKNFHVLVNRSGLVVWDFSVNCP